MVAGWKLYCLSWGRWNGSRVVLRLVFQKLAFSSDSERFLTVFSGERHFFAPGMQQRVRRATARVSAPTKIRLGVSLLVLCRGRPLRSPCVALDRTNSSIVTLTPMRPTLAVALRGA